MRTTGWLGRGGSVAAAAILAGALGAGAARADDERASASAGAKEEARAAARMGTEAFKAGRWADAIEALEHAESLVHAPTHRLMIARARAARGDLLAALGIYGEVAAEAPEGSEPAAFGRAREDAKREHAELQGRIPRMTIEVTPKDAADLVVTVDGRRVPASEVGRERALDPGKHVVSASAGALSTAQTTVTISERERRTVSLALVPPPSADVIPAVAVPRAPSRPARGARPAAPPVEEPWQASLRPAAIGALALGVASTALGSGLYALSSTRRGEADATTATCAPGCSADQSARAARLERGASDLQDAGIAGLVAGGVLVTGGLVLLVASAHGEQVEPSRPGARAFIGPMSAGASGTF